MYDVLSSEDEDFGYNSAYPYAWNRPNFGGYGSFDDDDGDDDSDEHIFGEDDDEMPGFSEWVLRQSKMWDQRRLDYDAYSSYGNIYGVHDYNRNLSAAESEKELRDLLANIQAAEEEIAPQDRTGTPEGMAASIVLLEHQKIGLTWLQKMEGGTSRGGILGDDMVRVIVILPCVCCCCDSIFNASSISLFITGSRQDDPVHCARCVKASRAD